VRHGDASEPKIKREKRETQRTDADGPKARRDGRETRHADASDPAKPSRPKKSSD
jgi:hypothetical protein